MTYLLCKVEILTKPDMPGGSGHKSGKLELDKQFGKEHTLSKNTWPDDQSVHHHKSTAYFDRSDQLFESITTSRAWW